MERNFEQCSSAAERLSTCDKVQQKTLDIDIYKTSFNFLLPNKKQDYKSFLGVCLSIMTFIILLSYGSYKMGDLIGFENYKLQIQIQENYFPANETFGEDQGLIYAAAMTDYGGEIAEDPTIATLKFYYKTFGRETDNGSVNFRPVRTKACLEEDLPNSNGSNSESSKFYPLNERYDQHMANYQEHMKCFDEEMQIYGDYDTDQA